MLTLNSHRKYGIANRFWSNLFEFTRRNFLVHDQLEFDTPDPILDYDKGGQSGPSSPGAVVPHNNRNYNQYHFHNYYLKQHDENQDDDQETDEEQDEEEFGDILPMKVGEYTYPVYHFHRYYDHFK